jgi:putative transposase
VEQDGHLLTMLRYVERNAARAGLVKRAEDWPWSSARFWSAAEQPPSYLVVGPVARPKNWLKWVNEPLTQAELDAVRHCLNRASPYGSAVWQKSTAERLGLESTMRPRGRPRKTEKDAMSDSAGP